MYDNLHIQTYGSSILCTKQASTLPRIRFSQAATAITKQIGLCPACVDGYLKQLEWIFTDHAGFWVYTHETPEYLSVAQLKQLW